MLRNAAVGGVPSFAHALRLSYKDVDDVAWDAESVIVYGEEQYPQEDYPKVAVHCEYRPTHLLDT